MGTLGVPRNLRANRGDLSQRGGLSERYWTEAMGVKRLFFHNDLPAAASPHAGRLHVLWSANTPKRPGGLPESRSCEVVPLLRFAIIRRWFHTGDAVQSSGNHSNQVPISDQNVPILHLHIMSVLTVVAEHS